MVDWRHIILRTKKLSRTPRALWRGSCSADSNNSNTGVITPASMTLTRWLGGIVLAVARQIVFDLRHHIADPGGDLRRRGDLKWPFWLSAPLATVAKTLALFEAGVKTEGGSTATGTSLDAMVVASTGGGVFFSVGGTSTLVGNLIGLAVYDAVAEGVRLEQEASGKSLGSAAARSVMLVVPDHVANARGIKMGPSERLGRVTVLSRPTKVINAGLSSPRRRRPPKHRVRRQRMPRQGMLIQMDGSHHPWLGDRMPPFTLLIAVDDATGTVVDALFCEKEGRPRLLPADPRSFCSVAAFPSHSYTDRQCIIQPRTRTKQPPPLPPDLRA